MPWRLRLLLALVILPASVVAQDWSGASLRAGRVLEIPPGYRLEIFAVGFTLPQDLALDPPDWLWLLTQADRVGGGAGALVRLPLGGGAVPLEAGRLPTISIPFSPDPARFRMGSLVRHPATGDLYVGERLGRHIFRVSPGAEPVLYARGLNLLALLAGPERVPSACRRLAPVPSPRATPGRAPDPARRA